MVLSRVAAVCWVLAVNFFIVQWAAQAQWHTPYSLVGNPISDLGATRCAVSPLSGYVCSPWHAGMNASFVVTGLLIAAGALVLAVASVLDTVLIVLGGAGWMLVGVFPADVALAPHTLGALLTFVAGNLGMLLHARRRGYLSTALLSTVGLAGAVVLICVLPAMGGTGKVVNGAVERVTAWPFPLAVVLCGVLALRAQAHRRTGWPCSQR